MTRLPQNLLEELEKAEKLMMDKNQNGLLSSGKSRYAIFINGISNQYIRIICQSRTMEFKESVDIASSIVQQKRSS
jgi:hypothetical protein